MFISKEQIKQRVRELGIILEADFKDSSSIPIFIVVMNGAFIFAADLVREYGELCEIDFCRVKSYKDNERSDIQFLKKWELTLKNREILIIDDITDSGSTMQFLIEKIREEKPKSITVCSLFKRKNCKQKVDIVGFEIDDDAFIYGYGLDVNNLQRNLEAVYKLKNK